MDDNLKPAAEDVPDANAIIQMATAPVEEPEEAEFIDKIPSISLAEAVGIFSNGIAFLYAKSEELGITSNDINAVRRIHNEIIRHKSQMSRQLKISDIFTK
jgi:hypothetical protein